MIHLGLNIIEQQYEYHNKTQAVFAAVCPTAVQVLVVAVLCLVRLGGKDVSPIYLGSTDSTFLAYGGAVSTLECILYLYYDERRDIR